jgi:hypothetical protein
MASPTDGDENVVLAGDADASDYIGGTGAAGDDSGTSINHGVGNSASFFISGLAGTKGLPAERGPKLLNGGFRDHLDSSSLMKRIWIDL